MPDFYVWLEYYAATPVSKNVKSDELKYADKHQHGVQPTQTQINSLQPSLAANVAAVYAAYNNKNPGAAIAVPSNATIAQGCQTKTRSAF